MNAFESLLSRKLRGSSGAKLLDITAKIQAALGQAGLLVPPVALADTVIEKRRPVAGVSGGTDGFTEGTHAEPAGSRRYKLFVPPGDRGTSGPRPMVVMLHGCTQSADDFAAGTRMHETAAREGFLVLYPEQAQQHNPQRCWNWFKHNHQRRDRGEPAILAGMVRAVIASQGVDPRRVFVAGLSAGGAMAAILGDAYPELFAAVGVHSGLPTGSARDVPSALAAMQGQAAAGSPQRKGPQPPTIVFHGDQDATVHPVNGERVLAGAAGGRVETRQVGGGRQRSATCHVHTDAQGHVRAEHWVVHGAGHAWSGGSAQGSYTDPAGPDASAEMWRFFNAVRR